MHPPPSPAQANFTLMTECTPESRRYYSVYSVGEMCRGLSYSQISSYWPLNCILHIGWLPVQVFTYSIVIFNGNQLRCFMHRFSYGVGRVENNENSKSSYWKYTKVDLTQGLKGKYNTEMGQRINFDILNIKGPFLIFNFSRPVICHCYFFATALRPIPKKNMVYGTLCRSWL